MKLGSFYFPTEYNMPVVELAIELENRGFESLFLCEHTHIPTSRKTPFPAGGDLPKRYIHTIDPFVALSFVSAATKTLNFGTGICLVTQREPIATAKAVASLDMLSGGRFIFGIGGGWNADEMENHGTNYKTRFQLLRERILAMKELWTKEEAEFHGDFVDFNPVWSYPKPVQRPHPPILLGGETDYTLKRVVDFCDGWFPRPSHGFDPTEGMQRLKEMATSAGRSMETLQVTVFRAPPNGQKLEEYQQAGIGRSLLEIPDAGREEILPILDTYSKLLAIK